MAYEIDATVGSTRAEAEGSAPPSRHVKPPRRWHLLAGGVGIAAVGLVSAVVVFRPGTERHAAASNTRESTSAGLPVNTISPTVKTLVRTVEQPGTIRPQAQGERYAKTSGYVRYIQRDLTAPAAAELMAGQLPIAGLGMANSPGIGAALLARILQVALTGAPQKDIGSPVRAGEIVMRLDVPELEQEVAQKHALYLQARAELRQAQTALGTFDAGITAAQAYAKQAESDIRRYAAEHTYQTQQLKRLQDLLRDRIGTEEGVAQAKNQVSAAQAA